MQSVKHIQLIPWHAKKCSLHENPGRCLCMKKCLLLEQSLYSTPERKKVSLLVALTPSCVVYIHYIHRNTYAKKNHDNRRY